MIAVYYNLNYRPSQYTITFKHDIKRKPTLEPKLEPKLEPNAGNEPLVASEVDSGEESIQLIFMSSLTCDVKDILKAQVATHSLKMAGYTEGRVVHGLSCEQSERRVVDGDTYYVEEGALVDVKGVKTSLNPHVVKAYLETEGKDVEGYVMLSESDGVFVKEPSLSVLKKQTLDTPNAQGFGQDAGWYTPHEPIVPRSVAEQVCGMDSRVLTLKLWRDYAVDAPFVLKKDTLMEIMNTYVAFFDKLPVEYKHLAYALTIAHHDIVHGVSGSLRLMDYGSPRENWDFAEGLTYNPCNSSIGDDVDHDFFPWSLRPVHFVLPDWPDGSKYVFSQDMLPSDFLSCDSWLLQELNFEFWEKAVHTYGYEKVTTILRRRHVFSVCTASRLYNRAVLAWKEKQCTQGYNFNKRLPMNQLERGSGLPFGTKDMNVPFKYYGDYDDSHKSTQKPLPGASGSTDMHFVFSTTCTGYQHWQSENLMYSANAVHQPGRFTRILSGCTPEQTLEVLNRGSTNPNLGFHVVPEYKDHPYPDVNDNNYTPYNKPFGIRHWLKHANPPVTESIIIVIDPDFYFLRQFFVNTKDSKRWVYTGKRAPDTVNDTVSPGIAVAQNWVAYLGPLAFTKKRAEENKKLCGLGPECQVSESDAKEYYSVGPPYALLRSDFESFIDDYCNITVAMRKLHPEAWMSEMYGYSMAAAKHNIKHTNLDNLAVTLANSEYWGFVENLKDNPCLDPEVPLIPKDAPFFMHACQQFDIITEDFFHWRFYKQLMPEDMYTCDAWLLEPPPKEVWQVAVASGKPEKLRKAYGMCTLAKIMNRALLSYKKKYCPNGYNSHKRLRLIDPRPSQFLKLGQSHVKWNYEKVIENTKANGGQPPESS